MVGETPSMGALESRLWTSAGHTSVMAVTPFPANLSGAACPIVRTARFHDRLCRVGDPVFPVFIDPQVSEWERGGLIPKRIQRSTSPGRACKYRLVVATDRCPSVACTK